MTIKLTANQQNVLDAIKDINNFDAWATLPEEGYLQCTAENGIRQLEAFNCMIGMYEAQKGQAIRALIKKGALKIVGLDFYRWRDLTVEVMI